MVHHHRAFGVAAILLVTMLFKLAAAQPPDVLRDYRFITSRSSVHVTGGFAGYDMKLAIDGRFAIVTGYREHASSLPRLTPYAQFQDVHAILFNPYIMAPLPLPGWDLDQTLNLSRLDGTYIPGDPQRLFFQGLDGQGHPLKITATIHNKFVHLVGENSPECCDFFHYRIDALAHLAPFADFSLNDQVDAADFVLWRKAHGADEDYVAWKSDFGTDVMAAAASFAAGEGFSSAAVPEPANLCLLVAFLLSFTAPRRGCRRRQPALHG